MDPLFLAEELLNRHLSTCLIATSSSEGEVNVAIMNSAQFCGEHEIEALHVAAERTVKNLRENPRAVFTIIVPDEADALNTTGVRVWVDFLGEEAEGKDFERLAKGWQLFHAKPKGRLLFKVKRVEPLWRFSDADE